MTQMVDEYLFIFLSQLLSRICRCGKQSNGKPSTEPQQTIQDRPSVWPIVCCSLLQYEM